MPDILFLILRKSPHFSETFHYSASAEHKGSSSKVVSSHKELSASGLNFRDYPLGFYRSDTEAYSGKGTCPKSNDKFGSAKTRTQGNSLNKSSQAMGAAGTDK